MMHSIPLRFVLLLGSLVAADAVSGLELEKSLVNGQPLGQLAVAGRLSIDLHAEFMLSRSYGTERALNWYNCGYSGGGAGGTTVGGSFGFFGFQVPFAERELRYPLAVSENGIPAVRFDGDDFLKGNFPIEPSIIASGNMALEVWLQAEATQTTVLGWQSLDGSETSGSVTLPASLQPGPGWRHLVINVSGDHETWWLDGKASRPLARTLSPKAGHVMVLGGASSKSPSFKGALAAVRLHDHALTDEEVLNNFHGGVMLGTEFHDWWRTEKDAWWAENSAHFRHAVDPKEMKEWTPDERAAFDKRVPEMFELAELSYRVYSERLAMRTSVVSVKPEERGDGIRYRIPIQPAPGNYMGFDGHFGWSCQGAGFINPHELVHGFQGMTGGMAGNFWETHANFPQTYLGIYQTVPVIAMETPAFPSSGRTYYHDRGLFEHLAQTPEYGPMFISKLWYDGPTPEKKDPYPWITFEKMNPYPDRDVGGEFTRMAMRNITWDYQIFKEFKPGVGFRDGEPTETNVYQKTAAEQAAGPQQALLRGRALLEKIPYDPEWWRVPKSQAPQQFGYNVCPLAFRPGDTVAADLAGYVDPARGGAWSAGFVGVKNDGAPVYGEIFRGGTSSRFVTNADFKELYLVVCATPSNILDIPMTGDFRSFEQEPFPWKVKLENCQPLDVLTATRGEVNARAHSNGGGLVEASAKVDATAWVGPDARVLGGSKVSGNARIEDHAVVRDSVVSDDAVVSGHALVMGGSTVSGRARVRDFAVIKDASTVTGDTRVLEQAVVATRKTCGGQTLVKGVASVYGGNQRGTTILDGWYAKGNEIDKGKWFTWSWGQGKNPGEVDEDLCGLLADFTFDKPHGWMARDDQGATWGYLVNQPRFVPASRPDDLAIELDGKSRFVELQRDLSDLRQATYTVDFRWDGKSEGARVFEFVGADGALLSLTPSVRGKMVFLIRRGAASGSLTCPPPVPNQWMQVRIVLDGPSAVMQVNGRTVSESSTFPLRPEDIHATVGYLGRGAGGDFLGGAIGRFTVHSISLIDKQPPAPDPATFEMPPTFVSPEDVFLTATAGEDPLGGVEYWFEEEGGKWNSGWTTERSFHLDGRDARKPLFYRFRMRDRNGNIGRWSEVVRSFGHRSGTQVHPVGPGKPAVVEAEDFLRNVPSADKASSWLLETRVPGFTGRGTMQVPDHGRRNETPGITAARLDYALRFMKTGTYSLWVRANGNNDGGQFIHAGLGLKPAEWGTKARTGFGRYAWTRLPDFPVKSPGDYLLSFWMAEDGAMIDRFILTTDPKFKPSPDAIAADGVMTGPGPAATTPETVR